MARLREQDRALAAVAAVTNQREQLGGAASEEAKEYRQELQQLPARILASGLGQTLAFYASKRGEGAGAIVGAQLARFLTGDEKATPVTLLKRIMSGGAAGYRRETREALAYAEWLKRYAAALIEKPEKRSERGR